MKYWISKKLKKKKFNENLTFFLLQTIFKNYHDLSLVAFSLSDDVLLPLSEFPTFGGLTRTESIRPNSFASSALMNLSRSIIGAEIKVYNIVFSI